MASKKKSPFVRTKIEPIDETKKKRKKKKEVKPYRVQTEEQRRKKARKPGAPQEKESKAHKEAIHQYSKERERIQRLYHSMVKRGYSFESNPVPPTVDKIRNYSPRKIRQLSQKIRSIKPQDLYRQARYGEISGEQGLKAERTTRAKRSAQTRRQNKAQQSQKSAYQKRESEAQPKIPNEYEPRNEQGFDLNRQKLDKQNKERLETDDDFKDLFQRGDYAYNFVVGLISDTIRSGKGWAGKYLKGFLQSQVDQFGYEKTCMAIGQAPDYFIEECQIVIEGSDKAIIEDALLKVLTLIKGAMPSDIENKSLNNAVDKDEYAEGF